MDVAAMRSRFPALDKGQIFLDNAGGTQALQTVLDSVGQYLYSANVQPGASCPTSQASLESIRNGHLAAAKFMNADPSEIVFGASATQLAWNLRLALADHFSQGDEIVLTKINHESHTSPWLQLAKDRGLTVRWYEPRDKKNPVIEADLLKTYLNSRTRLVVCVHVSNILGTINDVQAVATEVHGRNPYHIWWHPSQSV
ncbi:hypothetical protein PRZ48_005499 [Zasmidium cellare]|uniref:Aminotransferase class V domain-containing protein n=1 Tax=Zasmidium cellare TaxID=395010 RepID=A0ABR0EU30_ZASCE|nr:hypothetical protein PRZ48_005499 [Zasmidium cellare]